MNGPATHRLHDYEAGWLTLLLKMGVASEKALQEAQNRVARTAINEMNERRERRRAERDFAIARIRPRLWKGSRGRDKTVQPAGVRFAAIYD